MPETAAPTTPPGPRTVTIQFPGNTARVAFADPRRDAEALAKAADLATGRPVFLVIGGADRLKEASEAGLMRLFEWGLVPAAGRLGATLIDGGTDSGVMAVLGRASAASQMSAPLVGIAPAGKVTFPGDDPARSHGDHELEPNHGAFVLANSDRWGGETPLLFRIAEVVAGTRPIVAILAGGGDVALDEVRHAVNRRLPIVVLEGTGGVADELAAAIRSTEKPDPADPNADLRAGADLTFLKLDAQPAALEGILGRFLQADDTLREAWRVQRMVSDAAGGQQTEFYRGQELILWLGAIVTTLVVIQSVFDDYAFFATLPPQVETGLYVLVILVPIIITALTAMQGRFRPGTRWVLLRGASESIKREIYRYRARAGIYSPAETRKMSAAVKLSEAIGSSIGGLMRTDVSQLAMRQPDKRPAKGQRASTDQDAGPEDKPVSGEFHVDPKKMTMLSARNYVDERISGQIRYYSDTAAKLVPRARSYRMLAIAFGAVGTFLAAVGLQIWVAVATALVGIFTTFVESRQLEVSAAFYNQALADLTAIRAWWQALPAPERESQATIDRLVDRTEQILRAEHIGWVQEMQDAMTQFRLEQATDDAARQRPGEAPTGGEELLLGLRARAAGSAARPGPVVPAMGGIPGGPTGVRLETNGRSRSRARRRAAAAANIGNAGAPAESQADDVGTGTGEAVEEQTTPIADADADR